MAFGVGYSMTEGVVGDISIAERNLFGNGQSLRLKLVRQHDAAAGRGRLHRAALPRHQRRRRLRPLLQGRRLHHPGLLQEPEDRRRRARCAIPSATNGRSARTTRSRATRSTTSARTPPPPSRRRCRVGPMTPPTPTTPPRSATRSPTTRATTRSVRPRASTTPIAQDLAGLGGDVRYIRSVGRGAAATTPSPTTSPRRAAPRAA